MGTRIMRAGNRTVLHIPGSESGTGNLNIERLFLWRAGRWRDVDTSTWLGDLARRLPGRSARKGIYPDYPTMTAWTPLWVAGDGNSCPTGGRARLRLGWRGARIVLRSVHLERAAGCGEPAA